MNPEKILTFWFDAIDPSQWWRVDAEFDRRIEREFGALLKQATRGECFEWRIDAEGRLAEIIVLDQFSRNVHRGTPRAFAQDPMALALAQEAVNAGALNALDEMPRAFLLMPYMHSESPLIHTHAERLFRQFTPHESYEFEIKHKVIVDRFGRYPHRNGILGRGSTPEEVEFLKQPGSGF